jgi:hypothetical protein
MRPRRLLIVVEQKSPHLLYIVVKTCAKHAAVVHYVHWPPPKLKTHCGFGDNTQLCDVGELFNTMLWLCR